MSLQHNLTDTDLARLQTLIDAENVVEFWRVLGTDYQDTYADNAYAVIARPSTPFGEFFGTLVEQQVARMECNEIRGIGATKPWILQSPIRATR